MVFFVVDPFPFSFSLLRLMSCWNGTGTEAEVKLLTRHRYRIFGILYFTISRLALAYVSLFCLCEEEKDKRHEKLQMGPPLRQRKKVALLCRCHTEPLPASVLFSCSYTLHCRFKVQRKRSSLLKG
ncbi:hypothetical protein TRVL_06248 [Trypanosoma vivax]|nr:hypothetical protein TRVL_06248 [Trypanosoma vivax]